LHTQNGKLLADCTIGIINNTTAAAVIHPATAIAFLLSNE